MPGALPETFFSAKIYPHTHAWLDSYRAAVAAGRSQTAAPELLPGPEAANLIIGSGFAEPEGTTTEDPTNLKKGQLVAVYRNDDIVSKTNHRDIGRLITLTPHETTIAINAQGTDKELRIHCPRWQFAVEAVD